MRLSPGTRVRLTWLEDPAWGLQGHLVALRRDTLVVVYDGSTAEAAVPLAGLRSVEVVRGRRSKVGTDAAFGAIVGVSGCAFLCPRGWFQGPGFASIALGAAIGALGGATLGGVIGWVFGSEERWEPVPLDRVRFGLVPQRDGRLGLGAALAF